MSTRAAIIEIIFNALRSLNDELEEDKRVPIAADTKLFGPEASLDSLSLVSVIVDVESGVADATGKSVSLTDDKAMSQDVSPFSDVNALADYICAELQATA